MRGKRNTCNSPLQTSRSRCPLSSRLVQTRSPAGCQSCSGCWSRGTWAAVCSNSTVSQSLLLRWLSVGSTPGTSVGRAEWPEWAATASCCPYACHRRPHLSWIPCTNTDNQREFHTKHRTAGSRAWLRFPSSSQPSVHRTSEQKVSWDPTACTHFHRRD